MAIVYTVCVPHPPMIIPDIGRGSESIIKETTDSYHAVMKKVASYQPETIIVISPHSIMYSNYIHISPGDHAHGDFRRFRAKQVSFDVDYDEAFANALASTAQARGIDAGTLGERDPELDHGTMIPLYFLNHYYTDYKLVRLSISGLSFRTHYQFGQCIQAVADQLDRRIVVIASGDLSHKLQPDGPYGFVKEGPEFDKITVNALSSGHFLNLFTMPSDFCDKAAECGLRSFQIMAGALDGYDVLPHFYSYQDVTGVGYGIVDFIVKGKNGDRCFDPKIKALIDTEMDAIKSQEDEYVKLARYTIEHYVKYGDKPAMPKGVGKDLLNRQAGVFVSLHKDNQLRGCIGTFAPTTDNIAQEIMQNAISSCSRDPRFRPVRVNELDTLVYSVDVLGEREPVNDISELDPKKYGIIVTRGIKKGLLLPDLEGVDTVEDQIRIAKSKANIYEDQEVDIERFEVVRHT